MSSGDRAKIRHALDAGLPGSALTRPGPFLCYLTIDGLGREPDPRTATQRWDRNTSERGHGASDLLAASA